MSGQADIRRWFMKKPEHDKDKKNGESGKNGSVSGNAKEEDGPGAKYKKGSKFFAAGKGTTTPVADNKSKLKLDRKGSDGGKRKSEEGIGSLELEENSTPPKKPRMVIPAHDELPLVKEEVTTGLRKPQARKETVQDESPKVKGEGASGLRKAQVKKDTVHEAKVRGTPVKTPLKTTPASRRKPSGTFRIIEDEDMKVLDQSDDEADVKTTPAKGRGRGRPPSTPDVKITPQKPTKTPSSTGRGRGKSNDDEDGETITPTPAGRGRGRGGGGGGGAPIWAQPRGTPPHKGEKEVPQGAEDALAGLTFVISGTLDSLEREEAEILIKSHGGRVTGSVSRKTSFLLADEDIGGAKSRKAKELDVKFLTEDGLFDMIKASKPKASVSRTPQKPSATKTSGGSSGYGGRSSGPTTGALPSGRLSKQETPMKILPLPARSGKAVQQSQSWPTKHQPKTTADIIGNQSIVKQLRDWLQSWEESFGNTGGKGAKGKKRGAGSSSTGEKKAVLLSGTPGIGKTTTARLVCQELGYETLEVNASDSRGKSDSNIRKGMDNSTANTIKEMVNNESIDFKIGKAQSRKSALIMDEVDGMSGGDRGGVADLIASIKSSKIPIICICNDRYSQKLKSLLNYCLVLSYRKPTKQQMAKRLMQITKSEGIVVDEVTLEDIAERSNGDMRTSLNQLQYMSLRTSSLKFADVHSRLLASAKDEAISPFTAADKLLGFDGGRLRMDERVDLHMSDADLVPLLIQENYLNYTPGDANKDHTGVVHMDRAARAAMSIAEGDIVNGQIRRRNQWQLSQAAGFLSSIIPAALMQGQRKEYEGGRNFNRFPAWLGKQSNYKKKVRLLEDVHIHLLASRLCEPTREAIRMSYVPVFTLHFTHPLRHLPKDEAVDEVVNLMNEYSLTQEDYDTIMEVSQFKGHSDPLDGVPAAVKTALTKCYKSRIQDRVVRSADLLPPMTLPGQKKASKKPKRLVLVEDEVVDGDGELEVKEEPLIFSDEEEEDEDENENGNIIESLLGSNGTSKVTLDLGDQPKGRGAAGKSKASASKTPAKTPRKGKQDASTKAGPPSAKRRK